MPKQSKKSKSMHMMPNGHIMSDKEMKKMAKQKGMKMSIKKGKY